ncbi:hypothetical protein ECG_07553 [Echinococcus granulosus]|nr:hypothetical protein ECG_07553 [Echinococcus granulosus]
MCHFIHCDTRPTLLCDSLHVILIHIHFSFHHSHPFLQHVLAVLSFHLLSHLSNNPLLDTTTSASVLAKSTADRRRLSFHSLLAHPVTRLALLLPPQRE